MNNHPIKFLYSLTLVFIIALLSACSNNLSTAVATIPSTTSVNLPGITSVELDRVEVPRYESMELTLEVDAEYTNPYDAREISLDGIFTNSVGESMTVPGFWDGEESWKIRFTPDQTGSWTYAIYITDKNGRSLPKEGEFTVTASELHGWIQVGNTFDSSYSSHYFVHHDGSPFYGIGHCDALNILIDGFDAEDGVGLFDSMKEADENFVVWWPMYTNSIVASSYDEYSFGNMKTIDLIVKDAEKEGIFLIFTIWDHPNLRDDTHAWGDGNWSRNGFSKLGEIDAFFTSEESWVWQENLYRYIIARWGYSPAIGLWQTVAEINGTNSYEHTDSWHEKVNAYFVEHDPYRHPTTASGSGEVDWPTGHVVMDAPQMHLYDFDEDAVGAAKVIADWTQTMLSNADKPNWVGEFGVTGNSYYPELFHNSIWAALASGASMTPAEWNSGGSWGRLTPEMKNDLSVLNQFVKELPLAQWNPSALTINSIDPQVRAWGFAGNGNGLFWVQDFSLEGSSIEDVRNLLTVRNGVQLEIQGLSTGTYTIQPYDTWQGIYLESFDVECEADICEIALPAFKSDMAFKITQK